MPFVGMEYEAVLRHALTLEHQAVNEVAGVLTAVTGIMPDLMNSWRGEDADKFEQKWNEHRANLLNLHDALAGLVTSLHHNIAEQQRASES